jgi:hypothetical protein
LIDFLSAATNGEEEIHTAKGPTGALDLRHKPDASLFDEGRIVDLHGQVYRGNMMCIGARQHHETLRALLRFELRCTDRRSRQLGGQMPQYVGATLEG